MRRCISTAPRRSPPSPPARPRAAHQQRRQPVVADHQAQRQRGRGSPCRWPRSGRRGTRTTPAPSWPCDSGSASTYRSDGTPSGAEQRIAGARQRQDRQRDQQQVQRKQPARGAQVAFVAAFDHADVELVRQREHRQRAEQHQRREAARRHRRRRAAADASGRSQAEPDEHAQRQHRAELEQRLERHRQHQAAVVLGRATRGACRTASRTGPSPAPRTARCPATATATGCRMRASACAKLIATAFSCSAM